MDTLIVNVITYVVGLGLGGLFVMLFCLRCFVGGLGFCFVEFEDWFSWWFVICCCGFVVRLL